MIYKIEVAIECDNAETEGVNVLGLIVESLGLSVTHDDVTVDVVPSDTGKPVLLAVITAGESREDDVVDGPFGDEDYDYGDDD